MIQVCLLTSTMNSIIDSATSYFLCVPLIKANEVTRFGTRTKTESKLCLLFEIEETKIVELFLIFNFC